MRSVFDEEPGADLDDSRWAEEHNPEITDTASRRYAVNERRGRRARVINEDFFDDFGEDMVAKSGTAAERIAATLAYPMTDINGVDFEVEMSEDEMKNSIFRLVANLVVVSNAGEFENVDDFLYESGKMNDISSYRMPIDNIIQHNGSFYFVPRKTGLQNLKNAAGYLWIYFTTERDAQFRIDFKDVISLRRPSRQINITYPELCELMSLDKDTMLRKSCEDYYMDTLRTLVGRYQEYGVGLTLMQLKSGSVQSRYFGKQTKPGADMMLIKNSFTVLQKYSSKNPGDMNVLLNAMNEDMSFIESAYRGGELYPMNNDSYYVLIGGNEYYFNALWNSMWMGSSVMSNIFDNMMCHVRFYTPDPVTPVKKIEHNMLLVPLTKFVLASPCLLMFQG